MIPESVPAVPDTSTCHRHRPGPLSMRTMLTHGARSGVPFRSGGRACVSGPHSEPPVGKQGPGAQPEPARVAAHAGYLRRPLSRSADRGPSIHRRPVGAVRTALWLLAQPGRAASESDRLRQGPRKRTTSGVVHAAYPPRSPSSTVTLTTSGSCWRTTAKRDRPRSASRRCRD